ncbi:hypothetical protein LZ30DRAFT_768507 [Colletotrichum cereale]|nr:hypothetical protein LZ30DRAFT_768507 [Colletotrichum cereale]
MGEGNGRDGSGDGSCGIDEGGKGDKGDEGDEDEREASSLHGTLAPVSARIGSRLLSCPAYWRWVIVCHEQWRTGPAFLDGQVSREFGFESAQQRYASQICPEGLGHRDRAIWDGPGGPAVSRSRKTKRLHSLMPA